MSGRHLAAPSAKHRERPADRHLIFWGLSLGLLVAAEVVALFTKASTDVLSATMWWVYGERFSWRWWIIGGQVAALCFWMPPHWWFPEVTAQYLLVMSLFALAASLLGLAVTR